MTTHTIFDGRLQIYKRERSRYWQAITILDGKRFRISTKEESLSKAKDTAEDWYLGLRGKLKMGEPIGEKTFAEAVIPPFLMGSVSRIYAAIFSFIAGVIPPTPMLGRSLL